MGWASRLNNNPDKGKEKPKKMSKRKLEKMMMELVWKKIGVDIVKKYERYY